MIKVGLMSLLCLVLNACLLGQEKQLPFKAKNLLKNDFAMVLDAYYQTSQEQLRELTSKLYARNPNQLRRANLPYSIDHRLELLFGQDELIFEEVEFKRSTDAMLLALEPSFQGDRVFALMVGLISMVRRSYNNRREFFLFEELDQQKLYNSARNLEILFWRLANRLDENGVPILLTNELGTSEPDLSFERLFGKLIANQDLLARIASDRANRQINFVVHRLANAVFLPI